MVALQLKLEPDWKLSQIATAFGFYDEFHMSKAFKQKFGVSPSDYRNLSSNKDFPAEL
jgi:AraC-like DNA-binding protein